MILEHLVLQYSSIFSVPPRSGTLPLGGAFLETLRHRGQVGEVLSHAGNQRLNHVFILLCTTLSLGLLQKTHTPESHPVGLSTLSECPSGQTGQHCTSPPHSGQQFAIEVAPEIKFDVRITARQWENFALYLTEQLIQSTLELCRSGQLSLKQFIRSFCSFSRLQESLD